MSTWDVLNPKLGTSRRLVEGLIDHHAGDPSTASFAGGPPPHAGEVFSSVATTLAGQAGLLFGWTPDVFWAATPAELAALVRAASGGADVAAPVDLNALMERFPDE